MRTNLTIKQSIMLSRYNIYSLVPFSWAFLLLLLLHHPLVSLFKAFLTYYVWRTTRERCQKGEEGEEDESRHPLSFLQRAQEVEHLAAILSESSIEEEENDEKSAQLPQILALTLGSDSPIYVIITAASRDERPFHCTLSKPLAYSISCFELAQFSFLYFFSWLVWSCFFFFFILFSLFFIARLSCNFPKELQCAFIQASHYNCSVLLYFLSSSVSTSPRGLSSLILLYSWYVSLHLNCEQRLFSLTRSLGCLAFGDYNVL